MPKTKLFILIIIICSFILSVFLYPKMPEMMASHWNKNGEVDSYKPRFWTLFLMPLISLVIFLLSSFFPKIDPLKRNVKKFRKHFDNFIVLIIVFLFYIYLLSIFWNLGYRFEMGKLIIPAIGLLFYYSGALIAKSKRNWFIGIKTPWTLSSDNVWDKTHKIGSKLLKASGIIALTGIVFPNFAIYLVVLPILLVSIFLTFYSYFIFKAESTDSISSLDEK